jgi:hypothetical protein
MTRINNSLTKDSTAYDALSKIANATYSAGAKAAPYLVSAASITAKITTIGVAAILEGISLSDYLRPNSLADNPCGRALPGLLKSLVNTGNESCEAAVKKADAAFAAGDTLVFITPLVAVGLYYLFDSIEKGCGVKADPLLEKK